MELCSDNGTSYKNKFGFVDGSITIPKKKEDIPTWKQFNDLVAS